MRMRLTSPVFQRLLGEMYYSSPASQHSFFGAQSGFNGSEAVGASFLQRYALRDFVLWYLDSSTGLCEAQPQGRGRPTLHSQTACS